MQQDMKEESSRLRTGLPYQQEEPDAAGEVQQQRHGITWVAKQVDDGEEGGIEPGAEPAGLDIRAVEARVRRRLVGAGGTADEWRCKAPGKTDEDEAEDVVEDGRAAVATVAAAIAGGGHSSSDNVVSNERRCHRGLVEADEAEMWVSG
jgi:hypothetical protein